MEEKQGSLLGESASKIRKDFSPVFLKFAWEPSIASSSFCDKVFISALTFSSVFPIMYGLGSLRVGGRLGNFQRLERCPTFQSSAWSEEQCPLG